MVDPDIATALSALGLEPEAAEDITALRWGDGRRVTVRVRLRGGGSVKVRRNRPHKLATFAALVRALDDPRLPRVLAATDGFTVEEWVEGTPLAELPLAPERLAQVADLLGSLHTRPRVRARRTAGVVEHARRQLGALAAAGALAPGAGRRLACLLDEAPARAPVGVVHTDVCAENLVEDPAGRIHAIDNDGMQLGFLDHDLARTWYLWPMPAPSWRLLEERYQTWRPPDDRVRFWRCEATLKAAYLRLTRGGGLERPLARLAELAAGP